MTTTREPGTEEVRRLLDVEEIRMLLARYCLLCDRRADTSFVREIFTEDAIDDHGLFGKVFRGWTEIEEMYRRSSELLESAAHFVTNVAVDVGGDSATGTSYVQCWTWLRESAPQGNVRPADYVFVGMYDDAFRRTADGWRLRHRVMRPLGTGALGLGTAHETYFAAYHDPDYDPTPPTSAADRGRP